MRVSLWRSVPKRITALLLAVLCLLVFSACSPDTAAPDDSADVKPAEKGQKVVSKELLTVENASLRMEFDPKTCAFSIVEKESGRVWATNPATDYTDPYAKGVARTNLRSQLLVTYQDGTNTEKSTNSAISSVGEGKYEVFRLNSGVRVEYTFGEGFMIPVSYVLDGDGFVATILYHELDNPQEVPINDIALLPNFGLAGEDCDGYLVVPDGSGALIHFNNQKHAAPVYTKMVYGSDEALPVLTQTTRDAQILLPVFGMKRDEGGFVAIIEKGAGNARIQASVSGTTSAFNTVNAVAVYHTYERLMLLNGSLGSTSMVRYSSEEPVSDPEFAVRYRFLPEDKASYSGMAQLLREDWKKAGTLPGKAGDSRLYVDLYGGVSKAKSFLGFQYEGVEDLTTFAQAEELLEELTGLGADALTVGYRRFTDSALNGKLQTRLTPSKMLGGAKGWEKLQTYALSKAVSLYAFADFYDFTGTGNGASKYLDACKGLDLGVPEIKEIGLNTNLVKSDAKNRYLLSPSKYREAAASLRKSAQKSNVTALYFANTASRLAGDYAIGGFQRDRAITELRAAMEALDGMELLLSAPNYYLWEYADEIVDLPTQSGGHLLFDEDIPLLQMVLFGNVPYAGTALNLEASSNDQFLKRVETMSQIRYALIADDPGDLQNTEDIHLYGLSARGMETAAAQYAAMKQVYALVRGAAMCGHTRVGDMTATVYDNGVTVCVNYGRTAVSHDGCTVPGRGYAVLRGGTVLLSGNEVE